MNGVITHPDDTVTFTGLAAQLLKRAESNGGTWGTHIGDQFVRAEIGPETLTLRVRGESLVLAKDQVRNFG